MIREKVGETYHVKCIEVVTNSSKICSKKFQTMPSEHSQNALTSYGIFSMMRNEINISQMIPVLCLYLNLFFFNI